MFWYSWNICPDKGVETALIQGAGLVKELIANNNRYENENENLIVTPKDCDILTDKISDILSRFLNLFLQPEIEPEILLELV